MRGNQMKESGHAVSASVLFKAHGDTMSSHTLLGRCSCKCKTPWLQTNHVLAIKTPQTRADGAAPMSLQAENTAHTCVCCI